MALRQAEIPIYSELTFSLTANQILSVSKTCQRVNIIAVTGAVDLRLNDGDTSTCRGGIGFAILPPYNINAVTLIETAGSTASVTLAFSNGDVQDNRASFAGDVSVKNAAAPNDSLQVDMLAADAGLVALSTDLKSAEYAIKNAAAPNDSVQVDLLATDPGLVALAASIRGGTADLNDLNYWLQQNWSIHQNDEDLRKGLTTFASSAPHYETGSSAETTIVASGTNTAGIIVRHACCSRYSNADRCYLSINTSNVIIGNKNAPGSTANPTVVTVRDLFIDAGKALTCRADNNSELTVWYEVL